MGERWTRMRALYKNDHTSTPCNGRTFVYHNEITR